jgi:hypothetical protein
MSREYCIYANKIYSCFTVLRSRVPVVRVDTASLKNSPNTRNACKLYSFNSFAMTSIAANIRSVSSSASSKNFSGFVFAAENSTKLAE